MKYVETAELAFVISMVVFGGICTGFLWARGVDLLFFVLALWKI